MGTATKGRIEAGILVFVVFLLGVLLGGVGTHLWGARVWGQTPAAPAIKRVPGQFMAVMTQRLQLTPDQQKQFESMLDDTKTRLTNLYAPVDSERDQIRAANRARMRAVLTPDQQLQFDQVLKELGPPQNTYH
jgi:hypothetical protein